MKLCPYCGRANPDQATECRKCEGPFQVRRPSIIKPQKSSWVSPEKARELRQKALSALVLGLMVKVYWGGYGPWPVIDYGPWAGIRSWLEPLLLYSGGAGYLLGWVLAFV
jgi:ribosomal protein L40E